VDASGSKTTIEGSASGSIDGSGTEI
jgi:hypothetical protein